MEQNSYGLQLSELNNVTLKLGFHWSFTISWQAFDFKDIEPYFVKQASDVLPQRLAKSVHVTISKPIRYNKKPKNG